MNEEEKKEELTNSSNVVNNDNPNDNPYAIKWGNEEPVIEELNESTEVLNAAPEVVNDNTSINQTPIIPISEQLDKVVPIQPVATVPNTDTTPINQEPNGNTEPVIEEEKPEKKNTLKLVLLTIFFISLLAFVYFLPDVTEYFQNLNQPEITDPSPSPTSSQKPTTSPTTTPSATPSVPKQLVCSASSSLGESIQMNTIATVTYLDNKIKSSKLELVQTYVEQDAMYQALVNICNTTQIANNKQPGYHSECKIEGNVINVITEFDLEIFKPFTDISGNTIGSTIIYNSDIEAYKTQMLSQGAVCK